MRHTVIHMPQTFAHRQEHCKELINFRSLLICRGHLRIGLFTESLVSVGLVSTDHWIESVQNSTFDHFLLTLHGYSMQ